MTYGFDYRGFPVLVQKGHDAFESSVDGTCFTAFENVDCHQRRIKQRNKQMKKCRVCKANLEKSS